MKGLFFSLSALILVSAAHANLVVNGDFEMPTYTANGYDSIDSSNQATMLPGWTVINEVAGIGTGYLGAPSQEVDLSGARDLPGSGIFQTLNLVAGQTYDVSFDYFTGVPTYSGDVSAWVGSQTLASNLTSGSRTTFTGSFVAVGGGEDLKFIGTSPVSHIDNVSVVAAVPEPASMIALGLGALGLIRRKKNA